MAILVCLSGFSHRQSNVWPHLAEKDLLLISSSLERFWKGRNLADGWLCRYNNCINHTVMVAAQGTATASVTIFFLRATVPCPNSRKLLNLELPLLPWLWLWSKEVQEQLDIRVMLSSPVCILQSRRMLYNSTKTCSAPQRLYLIDLEQGPLIVLKANHKSSGCC